MGFWSDCYDIIGGVIGAVSDTCKAVIDTAVSVTKEIGTFVNEVIKLPIEKLKSIIVIAVEVCKLLGLIEEKNPEELGDKVLQAQEAGISPEDYANIQEYKEMLKDFDIDPEKSSSYSEVDKYIAAGVYCELALVDKFGSGIGNLIPLIVKNPNLGDSNKLKDLFLNCEKNNISMTSITGYLNDKLRGEERLQAKNAYQDAGF